MKKVMSLVAMFAVSAMLAGCYSKACEEPVAPAPYKDSTPVATPQEEAKPVHHKAKRHHKAKHYKHATATKAVEETTDATSTASNAAEDATTTTTTTTQQ